MTWLARAGHHCALIKKIGLFGALAVCALAMSTLACGGGAGGVADDFCAKFARATCMKTISCADAANPLPAGFTMSNCVPTFTMLCTKKLSIDEIEPVNCYGATHVNGAAQTMCLAAVNATTCDQIDNGTFTYDDVCSMVCSTAASGDAGSSGAVGTTSSGTARTRTRLSSFQSRCTDRLHG